MAAVEPIDLLIFEPSLHRVGDRLRQLVPGIRLTVMDARGGVSVDGRGTDLAQATATVGWGNFDVFAWPDRREYFRALLKLSTLRWVQSAAAGVDDAVFARLVAKGVALTNSDAQGPSIADFVLGGALDFFQKLDDRRALQAAARWDRLPYRELSDTRWLIIGYGRIGRETARRARGFGATVIGVRRHAQPDELATAVVTLDQLAEQLPAADVVVLSCGLNPETKGLADAGFFARMKPGSLLINVGRGGLVDELALLASLEHGRPARAVLDVFATEPLPADSPFWRHPQVRVSAHTSATGSGLERRGDELFLDNLGRYARGEPLRNRVDPGDLMPLAE